MRQLYPREIPGDNIRYDPAYQRISTQTRWPIPPEVIQQHADVIASYSQHFKLADDYGNKGFYNFQDRNVNPNAKARNPRDGVQPRMHYAIHRSGDYGKPSILQFSCPSLDCCHVQRNQVPALENADRCCELCGGRHSAIYCSIFPDCMSQEADAHRQAICFRCNQKGGNHRCAEGRASSQCRHCSKRHNTLYCIGVTSHRLNMKMSVFSKSLSFLPTMINSANYSKWMKEATLFCARSLDQVRLNNYGNGPIPAEADGGYYGESGRIAGYVPAIALKPNKEELIVTLAHSIAFARAPGFYDAKKELKVVRDTEGRFVQRKGQTLDFSFTGETACIQKIGKTIAGFSYNDWLARLARQETSERTTTITRRWDKFSEICATTTTCISTTTST